MRNLRLFELMPARSTAGDIDWVDDRHRKEALNTQTVCRQQEEVAAKLWKY
jgi:hypothetical protein